MSYGDAYGVAASPSGRVAIALPLGDVFKVMGALMAVIIMTIAFIIWPIMIFWHELCWATMILAVIFGVRKVVRSYYEGKNG